VVFTPFTRESFTGIGVNEMGYPFLFSETIFGMFHVDLSAIGVVGDDMVTSATMARYATMICQAKSSNNKVSRLAVES